MSQRVELVLCEDCPDREYCATPENRCAFIRWLFRSCAESGVPVKVTDPEVLAQVAILLWA